MNTCIVLWISYIPDILIVSKIFNLIIIHLTFSNTDRRPNASSTIIALLTEIRQFFKAEPSPLSYRDPRIGKRAGMRLV